MARALQSLLVVEDDGDIRDVLREVLEGEGYRVTCARNGLDALHCLESLKPGAILLDLMMPVMNGTEFLDRVKGQPSLSDIPVLVFSGTRDDGDALRARGVHRIVRKPIDLQGLLAALAETLPGHAAGA